MRSGAVVIFFTFREVIVRDKAWVALCGVIADWTVCPAVIEAVLRPYFMDVSCHVLDEWKEFVRQVDAGGVCGLRNVSRIHKGKINQSNESMSMKEDHVSSAG